MLASTTALSVWVMTYPKRYNRLHIVFGYVAAFVIVMPGAIVRLCRGSLLHLQVHGGIGVQRCDVCVFAVCVCHHVVTTHTNTARYCKYNRRALPHRWSGYDTSSLDDSIPWCVAVIKRKSSCSFVSNCHVRVSPKAGSRTSVCVLSRHYCRFFTS